MTRFAVIVETEEGGQVCGITGEEARRLATNGEYQLRFNRYKLRVIVDERNPELADAVIAAIPWGTDL